MIRSNTRRHQVVLCADDYGMNPGVSRAILDLAAAGRLSATTCMTNAAFWPQAARDIEAANLPIGIGLHLSLSWGAPLGPMPAFAPDGRMPPIGDVMRRAFTGRLPRAEIAAEIGRQLDRFEAELGRMPDFVEGHQHVHVLPGVRGALLEVLGRRGLAGQIWLRDPSDRVSSVVARRLSAGKAMVVSALAVGFRREAGTLGFATNNGFSGFSDFSAAGRPDSTFEAAFSAMGPRHLVMCHPGLPSADDDEIAEARHLEHAYLASDAFRALLDERSIALTPNILP